MLEPVYIARSTPQDCGERFIKHRRAAEITSTPPQRNAVPQRYDHWVAEIHRLLGSERAGTIDLARLLYEARRELRGGEWSTLWRGRWIPFSKRKGDMLVTIGRELGNLDEQNLAQLPLHWSVLYEIALFGTNAVLRLIV